MTSCLRERHTRFFSAFVLPLVFCCFVCTTTNNSFAASPVAYAQEETEEAKEETAETAETSEETTEASEPVEPVVVTDNFTINNLWIMIAGMLVFIMHLGFATLESGLTRSKNTVNILFKNTAIVCIGLISYGVIGFHLMYPGFEDAATGYVKIADGWNGFLFNGPEVATLGDDPSPERVEAVNGWSTQEYNAGYTQYTDFFFQAMFAATCCTIVSGAVAGRIKLGTFLVFCLFFVSISYPITGSWQWGEGWLNARGFYDLAGSTLVHSVGGWGALVMAFLLGPRAGKYVDGRAMAIQPSNMPLAAIGVFLLWFGWFGFNAGSVLSADPGACSLVLCTTSMAAAAGGLSAAIVSTVHGKKPDLSMTLNGILAGLVGITAGADQMSMLDSIIIGLIAGFLVYVSVIFIDSILKVDDPVGAISVHLVCGIWGTLAVGIFGAKGILGGNPEGVKQLTEQVIGIGAVGAFTVVFCLVIGLILRVTAGLRVPVEEEQKGLDLGEHGIHAYSL